MKTFFAFLLVTIVTHAGEPGAARDLSRKATELYNQARYAEAEPLFRRALEYWNQLGPQVALPRAEDMRNLGSLLRARGRYAEAETLLIDAAAQLEANDAPALDLGRAWYNLAALYRSQGDLARAESSALRATEIIDKSPDISGPERLGARLVLSSIYIEQHRLPEAEAILTPALETADGALAVVIYDNLATIAIARGEYEKAESSARRALYFARLALPANHPALAASFSNLAQACRFRGEYLQAEDAYRKAIAVWEESLGPSHPEVAKGLMNLGAFYHERGRETGAERLYARAAGILEQSFGKDDPRTLTARNELAEVLRGERRYTESTKIERSTLAGLEKQLPTGDPRLLRAQENYSRLLQESGSTRCRKNAGCQ
jgi:tetratricopeptide (TPR) repeat protein